MEKQASVIDIQIFKNNKIFTWQFWLNGCVYAQGNSDREDLAKAAAKRAVKRWEKK